MTWSLVDVVLQHAEKFAFAPTSPNKMENVRKNQINLTGRARTRLDKLLP
jgi:hypothetical protein